MAPHTVYLRLPSFSPKVGNSLIELLKKNKAKLSNTRNWIIDVRNNDGGSDSSYEPLLPWILDNETANASTSWFVTDQNIAGQRTVCAQYAPGDRNCEEFMRKAIERMEGKPQGSWAPMYNGPDITFRAPQPHVRAQKVAVLIDKGCVSSCEQFLLQIRQSFNVKLIGQSTYGALDYSNLRPYNLPSGERQLWYATSRSARLPHYPIDGRGVTPDIYLPPTQNQAEWDALIVRAKAWLEGGSLAPGQPQKTATEPRGTGKRHSPRPVPTSLLSNCKELTGVTH